MADDQSLAGTSQVPSPPPKLLEEVHRNFFQEIYDWLWGYDFFISYQWSTGGQYAQELALRLREKGYEVFLDRSDYAASDDWKRVGSIALNNTQRLVLISTKGAVTESKPVAREVEIFTKRGRRVIPIVFEHEVSELDRLQASGREKESTLSHLSQATLYISEAASQFNKSPSPAVINRLVQTHEVLRRRKLRGYFIALALIIVAVFAINAHRSAQLEKEAAIAAKESAKEAKQAQAKETEARELAEKRQKEAEATAARVARENADNYWRFAIRARDPKANGGDKKDVPDTNNLLTASHLFLRGSHSFQNIPAVLKTDSDQAHSRNFSLAAHAIDSRAIRTWLHPDALVGMKVPQDEQRLLTWNSDGTARLWDVTKPEPLQTFKHNAAVIGVQFNHDESRVLTWSYDDTARLWDVTKPQPL